MFKTDTGISFFVGGLVALFAIPTLVLVDAPVHPLILIVASFVIFPLGAVAGFWVFSIIAHRIPVFLQLAKFAIIGFSNFAIDSGVLSLISLFTGVTKGGGLAPMNLPGFLTALLNSYYWNKYWTFREQSEKRDHHDFLIFLAVTIVGFLINTGAVIVLTTNIGSLFGLSENRWLVASKIVATVLNLIWNFTGLKFFVFKKRAPSPAAPSQVNQ
ncbi:MAG: hypothetical protein A3I44_01465 [Candidatus Sungbacteria bacterium RIFCSPLOWO2_02_FULL_51_17]|uniref:GtrA/DPMS transmembrane domain-containing protein n=1 Tax=Candidatus Sungbacteria bacterium RIFCSPHIGHO2_02_FULL_51_29 TaxID=1802273 RepID=A0A1G2KXR8_9BACT|nr:MAG: hypothetical protein A2676_05675 [Candidatus Sungbacteria bacterium RIFCSPHIGHO2_01_FULL_51_22]OHA03229.1 MAG: hypothetical protein A3C16_01585 [Candidatus Sungbacteria bacterium RIFCSPHIGHO2_02_FULL_51_29]OHA10874.1 MAG: hypothetical protein A3I44_01465 [Candidatus Sungbacteria bacterium RIFCSPLOWO2_02_FULL_51_17]